MKMRGFGWKKNKNYIVYFLTCMVLVGIMLIFSYSKVIQAKEAERVVKIGIYELPGFCEVQDDGYVGYNMEYLAEVAELTGWKYEYVVVSDYEAGRRKLEQRKIDLLAPSQKNVEEMAHFLYSEYSFGRQYTALITEVSRADLNYEVYEEFQGMRVAVVEGSSYTDNFSEYAQKHSLEVEYVYGKSTTEVLNLLHSRKVDAAVVNLMEAGQRHKVLARFSQMPFYYLTYQGNEVLLEELNEAMYHLQSCRPKLINDLTEIYLPIYEMQYMTAEQRYFIDSSKTIRVGYVQDNIVEPVTEFVEDVEEDIDNYPKDNRLAVFSFFVSKENHDKIVEGIKLLKDGVKNTTYGVLNILTLPFKNINLNLSNSMICSQFVDSMLKIANIDIIKIIFFDIIYY